MGERRVLWLLWVLCCCCCICCSLSLPQQKQQRREGTWDSCRPSFVEGVRFDASNSIKIAVPRTPTDSFECDACDLVVKELVSYLNDSQEMGETAFHQEADEACLRLFDEWLAGFCMYPIDEGIIQFYDVFVKKKNPQLACQALGVCNSPSKLIMEESPSSIININPESSSKKKDKIDNGFSFVVLSDMHIGQRDRPAYTAWLSHIAIEKINSLIDKENIKFVVVTGDLTDSAMPTQWAGAKSLLDQLKVPYFPTLGNHDVWSYNNSGPYEEPHPTGDAQFARTFATRFTSPPDLPGASLVYNNKTCYNPHHNITSWFQNWMLSYNDMVFIGLDWNSREHAVSSLGYKGAWPGADPQNFTGGTLPWLQQQLRSIPRATTRSVVLFQHHPFAFPYFLPEAIYSFSAENKAEIRGVIEEAGKDLDLWGVIAGHLHIWFDGMGFTPNPLLPHFKQWLTEATKVSSAMTMVNVDGSSGKITKLTRMYGIDY